MTICECNLIIFFKQMHFRGWHLTFGGKVDVLGQMGGQKMTLDGQVDTYWPTLAKIIFGEEVDAF